MSVVHFLNVLEGDCNIIQHDSGRVSVIDVSNAYNKEDTVEEKAVNASQQRRDMHRRTQVPSDKKDYYQKLAPDNPIEYLRDQLKVSEIFRFIITHPDMDHLDGIRDLYSEFSIGNTWDTDNNKKLDLLSDFAGYNKEDWKFYTDLRDGKYTGTKRLNLYDNEEADFWKQDNIKILAPSKELVIDANKAGGDIHDLSYVLLYTPPRKNGGHWKIIFAGDSHDSSWNYILTNYKEAVTNIDILFAPHHGRDSDRNYDFLKILNPRVTLFGNASSRHLAYTCYNPTRITNNQAGYVIMEINEEAITFLVKNYEFARDYNAKKGWGTPPYYENSKSYGLFKLNA